MKLNRFLAAAVLLAMCWAPAAPSSADVFTWTGAVDSTWDTAGNWDPAGTPSTSADSILLTNGGTIDLGGSKTVGNVGGWGVGAGTVGTIQSGSLNFAGDMVVKSGTINVNLSNTGAGRLWIGGSADTVYLGGDNNVTFSDKYATIIGYSGIGGTAGTVKLTNGNALNADGQFTDVYNAALDFNGQTDVRSGQIRLRGATATALMNSSTTAASTAASIGVTTGTAIGGSGDLTFNGVVFNSPNPDNSLADQGFTKVGAGKLTLAGVNTFSGVLTVADGTLSVSNWNADGTDGALGNSFSKVVLGGTETTGTLEYTGGPVLPPNALRGLELAAEGMGKVRLQTTVSGRNLGFVHLDGSRITGSGGLVVETANANRFIVVGSAGYTGPTVVAANSELQCNYDVEGVDGTPFGINSQVSVGTGGFLTFYSGGKATTVAIGSLTGSGTVRGEWTPGNGPVQTLKVGGDGSNAQFGGTIENGVGSKIALTKVGSGAMFLGGTNTYTGDTTVDDGFLVSVVDNTFSAGSRLVVNANGYVDLNQKRQTVKGLAGSGYVYSNLGDNTNSLTVDVADGVTETFSGVLGYNLAREGATNTWKMGLTKTGAGVQALVGVNTYTGPTDVQAGTLSLVGGSLANGKVTVKNLAAFTMDSSAALTFNIDGLDAGSFDVFTQESGGSHALAGSLNLDLGSVFANGSSWQLFSLAGGSADGFSAINLTGGIYSGSLTETSGVWAGQVGGQNWTFTEATGVLSAVPEPGTLALLATGLFGLLVYAWRKRK